MCTINTACLINVAGQGLPLAGSNSPAAVRAKIVPLVPDVVVTKLVAEGSVGDYDDAKKEK